jgi:hypothetical protein
MRGDKMTKEDIEFLKDLQHELNTQPNDGNADPVFWVVAENNKEYGYEEGYADDVVVCNVSTDETWDNSDEFLEYLIQNNYIDKDKLMKDYDYDLQDLLDIVDDTDFYMCGYQKKFDVPTPNTFFLTKRACNKHINNNGYHYSEPHIYAMTAWRSPEFERFMKLFKSMDLNRLEEK